MGRRKITIRQIVDPKLRHITFNKRKNGLIKKAAELSLLCNVNMLLIFEDGNGNLIQFSKNKLNSIPGFFQECRYNNLLEFVAKDYPNFFKVNHYKKHKERETEEYDQDDFDLCGEDDSKLSYDQSLSQSKFPKRSRPQGHIKEEDDESSKIIYQSGSEYSDVDPIDEMNMYSETQPNLMKKNKSIVRAKPMLSKPEEKPSKTILNKEDVVIPTTNEQEIYLPQKEALQPYKEVSARLPHEEKPTEYSSQYMGFEPSFKRPVQIPETGNSQFRFYPGENTNLNAMNAATNPFVNTPNYPNSHPYILNNHTYPPGPASFQNNKPTNRLRGFGNINMGHMTNEDTLNAMFKGFNPLGFTMGGGNPFMTKPATKSEMDEKMIDTANMIKYLNGAASANTYTNPKMYNFHSTEVVGKPEEGDSMSHFRGRNDHEGTIYDNNHDNHELPSYVRGDYRLDAANMPTNMPSAYFSSKKFNFDGYFNNFEDGGFSEFAESKKRLKQGQ